MKFPSKNSQMKIIIVSLSMLIFTNQLLFSQALTPERLDKRTVKTLINREFGILINPQTRNNLGNFASLDLNDAKVSFSGNIIFRNGSILGIKTSGSVTDGFLPIFRNSSLNSNLQIDIQYNLLNLDKNSIQYYAEDKIIFEQKVMEIERKSDLRKIEFENDFDKKKLELDIQKLKDTIEKIKNTIEQLSNEQEKLKELRKDSLQVELFKKKETLKHLEENLAHLNEDSTKRANKLRLDNSKELEIRKLRVGFPIQGVSLNWFSFGYGLSNTSFKLFDNSLPQDQQIVKESYPAHTFRIQHNWYSKSVIKAFNFLLSIGMEGSIKDNLSSLELLEINERTDFGENKDDRYSIKKFNVYQGDYEKDLKEFALYTDFYWFLFEEEKAAFHVYPEIRFEDGLEPSQNLGLGLFLAFKNEKKESDIINTELYALLSDLSNNNDLEDKLLKRSEYGLRFTFPINFNFNRR